MDNERDVYEEGEKRKNEIMPDIRDRAEDSSPPGNNHASRPEEDPALDESKNETAEGPGTDTPQEAAGPEIEGAGTTKPVNSGPEKQEEEARTDKTGPEGENTARDETESQEEITSEQDKENEVREEGTADGVHTDKKMNTGEVSSEHEHKHEHQEEAASGYSQGEKEEVKPAPAGVPEPENRGTAGQEEQPAVKEDGDTPSGEVSSGDVADTKEATVAAVPENQEAPDEDKEGAVKKEDQAPEANRDEEEEDDESDSDEEADNEEDYGNYSKKELVRVMDSLVKENNIRKADRLLKEIKPAYDNIRDAERSEALKKFIAEGGSPDDFDYKLDDLDIRFDANFTLLKDRKAKHYKSIEKEKEENLAAKNELLERLRKLVDDEETTASISALKEIQKEWRAIGQIPGQHVKNLWANYNALLDRFYDNRSIYFELKELDRKKNLESKLELCEKAEELEKEENLKQAIKDLNELHEEFKHIGPVPKEEQEPLWQRFKLASDKVYARRREYVDHLKADLHQNQEKKRALGDRVQEFLAFDSDRINDWNKKTKEILSIQKEWEAIGGLPRDSAREINKYFWSAFKGFFNKKSGFFKKLEGQREENLKKKQELVRKAESLADSTDWNTTANELKRMQQEWKEIGPVPEKFRNSVYLEFKKYCDHFFENKRSKNKEVVQEYDENLKKKQAICAEIEEMAKAHSTDLVRLEQLQDEFNAIGFVPKNAIKTIQKRFMEAVNTFAKSADDLDDQERHNIELAARFNKLKSSPNSHRKIHQKENELRKQIGKLENDISLWKNNLEFFADSKKADKLKEDFNEKINNAKKELKEMQDQLYIIRNI